MDMWSKHNSEHNLIITKKKRLSDTPQLLSQATCKQKPSSKTATCWATPQGLKYKDTASNWAWKSENFFTREFNPKFEFFSKPQQRNQTGSQLGLWTRKNTNSII